MQALKYSRQREAIKELLITRKDHPTADMIYTELRRTQPNISLGTVYRNLALLAELGEIKKFSAGDGVDRYEADLTPHSHFVCRECGAVLDMKLDHQTKIRHLAEKNFEGIIEDCSVNFYGICPACKQKSKK
ncbi:transcriptional repressor [Blautia liquoris]|uniref:Transcriptional repressor n=1 Tax=Blautia liquoris TaxID=2779518 RepID=A0A7M2RH61_9FIRM|nr:transcriptional repressor [Blautia liquoris]QOV19344.1 transcriptional repressor [Blautia liquoris]